jgi:hypothetical protein
MNYFVGFLYIHIYIQMYLGDSNSKFANLTCYYVIMCVSGNSTDFHDVIPFWHQIIVFFSLFLVVRKNIFSWVVSIHINIKH